ncbi:MAG: group II intron reverse transcriptase/maturase [Simkania sp.]|nr:group II intron reverse transcriptase/maturase [Simkania sp.]
MTTLSSVVGAPLTKVWSWESIDWKTAWIHVRKLQMRIAKAVRSGRYGKAKALQWILTHSFYAKLIAVKRVTQNKGKITPGIDRILWKTANQKMQAAKSLKRRGYKALPLRRVYIPKKNGKSRPLGIPAMIDRAQQALHLLALEPIAEIQADKNSYGFRPKRSCHDAIEQCFIALARKYSSKWILEGDIKSCFDQISHTWLENNITMDKRILRQWLKAGYIEEGFLYPTERGTPQGGLASPVLCNMALDGLEKAIKSITKPGDKINYVRYADDWICTAENREILESKVLPTVVEFLKERGLELSQEKTRITHINEGFDFLGFSIRKYKEKLLIKPSKKSVKSFLKRTREIIHTRRAAKQSEMIKTLNPKIQGWTNYYRHSVAKRIFSQVDTCIFKSLWRWAKRRHPNKSITWIKRKYFPRVGLKSWCFCTKGKGAEEPNIFLKSAAKTRIVRHVKIKAEATPYDSAFKDYFARRSIKLKKHEIQPG